MNDGFNSQSFQVLNLPVERIRLANGLTVLLQPGARSDVCSVHTWLRAGSAHDPLSRSGLAHFFEHLMFTGTDMVPESELDHWVEQHGGQINAATWLDWTYFHAELPSSALVPFLNKESNRFGSLLMEPERMERERSVVLAERREQVEDEPESLLSEKLWSHTLAPTGYGRPTIGYTADIKQISRNECLDFYRSACTPQNLVISISGRYDRDAVLAQIAQGFSEKGGHRFDPKNNGSEHGYTPGYKAEITLPTLGEKLYLGLPAPSVKTREFAALEILHHALLEGETGRLQRSLLNEREWVSYAFGFLPSLRHQSLYEMGFDLRRDIRAEQVLEFVKSTLDSCLNQGLTAAELERAQNRIELTSLESLQTVEQRAHAMGFWEIVCGDCAFAETRITEYQTLDLDFIQETARQWWSPDMLSWVIGRCDG